jgi:DNA-binding MurR/RpiR family transcriptional regulator
MPDDSLLLRTAPFALARSCLATLPRNQQRLAVGLLEQPQTFAFGSIRDLGRRFDVDATTVLRLAQALGYSGHQALRTAVRDAYLAAGPDGAPERAARTETVRACHVDGLAQAHRCLGAADLERAAALLAEARPVLVAGTGVPAILAALLARLLRDAGVAARRRRAGTVDAGAGGAFVAIASARGATTVTIAASPAETVSLVAPAGGAGLPFSTVAAVAVIELLAAAVAARLEAR